MKPVRRVVPKTGKRFRLVEPRIEGVSPEFRMLAKKSVRAGIAKLSQQSINRLKQLSKSSGLVNQLGQSFEVNGKRYIFSAFRLPQSPSWHVLIMGKATTHSIEPGKDTLLWFSDPKQPHRQFQAHLETGKFRLVESRHPQIKV